MIIKGCHQIIIQKVAGNLISHKDEEARYKEMKYFIDNNLPHMRAIYCSPQGGSRSESPSRVYGPLDMEVTSETMIIHNSHKLSTKDH